VEAGPKEQKYVPADLVNQQIDNAIPLGLQEVKVTGGEPLLFRYDALAILAHAAEIGLKTRLETNAFLINDDTISLLKDLATTVTTSLDSANPDLHDEFRNAPGGFERTRFAMAAMAKAGIRVEIVSCIHANNLHEIHEIIKICCDSGVSCIKFNFPSPYGRAVLMNQHFQLCSTQSILDTVRDVEAKYPSSLGMQMEFDVPRVFRIHPLPGPRCHVLNLLSILPDGRYSLCGIGVTRKYLTFGSILEIDIDKIWHENDMLNQIRDIIANKKERGICGYCTEYDLCLGHCNAYSFSRNGWFNGPYPVCHDAFEKGLFPKSKVRRNELI
jgi:radical SAM protein with 4Fe4S-binding SPASM domain